jgi:CheY-specific phosphatase CheX
MIDLNGNETSDDLLLQIVNSVTYTFLNTPALCASPPDGAAPPEETWTGSISITGGFNGAVSLTCSPKFAHRAAKIVFGDECAGDDAFALDILAELTNVVGGNIKGLFSDTTGSTCAMSIPSVSAGKVFHPASTQIAQLWADCDSERLGIAIFQAGGDPQPLN